MNVWVTTLGSIFIRLLGESQVLLHQDPSHLPGCHLPVVSVGVVVPLDGEEVGVEGEEGGRHQTLLLRPPQAGRQGYVAQFIKNLIIIENLKLGWIL